MTTTTTPTLSSERIVRMTHPAWCDDHTWDANEDGWHECKPVDLGAWSLYLTTGGLVDCGRPVVSLEQADDEYMTPTYARPLARALVMAADAVEQDRPLCSPAATRAPVQRLGEPRSPASLAGMDED